MAVRTSLTIMASCDATARHKYRPLAVPSPALHALGLSAQITPKELFDNVMKLTPKCMHLR